MYNAFGCKAFYYRLRWHLIFALIQLIVAKPCWNLPPNDKYSKISSKANEFICNSGLRFLPFFLALHFLGFCDIVHKNGNTKSKLIKKQQKTSTTIWMNMNVDWHLSIYVTRCGSMSFCYLLVLLFWILLRFKRHYLTLPLLNSLYDIFVRAIVFFC